MNAPPTIALICDNPPQRVQLISVIRSAGLAIEVFDDVSSLTRGSQFREPSGPIVIAGCDPAALQTVLQHAAECDWKQPVIQLSESESGSTLLQALRPESTDRCETWESGTRLVQMIRQMTTQPAKAARDGASAQDLCVRAARLTRRENQVLERVVRGMMNKQIASDLGLSPKTVEVHRAHVMEKMQAETLAELVRMAVRIEDATGSMSDQAA